MSGIRVVVLLGAPGSGKGTQATRLSAAMGVPHVATGDLFRANLDAGTPLGEEARSYMDSGHLVPDAIVTRMLFSRVAETDCSAGFVLDGFPRTVAQAETMEQRASADRWQTKVCLLEVPDEVIVERATGRLLCKECSAVFHAATSPPKVKGRCDVCGAQALYRRDDDAPEVVRRRLEVFHAETEPTIAFFRERGTLEEVDGDRPIDQVQAELARRIGRAA